ncbi:phage major capsid protein [Thalassotalea euphylliae]|uniref:phage major capsid protein n=1 Tax=Thalassotalea euphylliae TaxID=1655234 RepID=UPI00363562F0
MKYENKMMDPTSQQQEQNDTKAILNQLGTLTAPNFEKTHDVSEFMLDDIKANGLAITNSSGADKAIATVLLDAIVEKSVDESDIAQALDAFNMTDKPEEQQLIRLTDKQVQIVDEQDFNNLEDYVHTDSASFYKAKNSFFTVTAHEVVTNETMFDGERVVRDLPKSIKRQVRVQTFTQVLHGDNTDPRTGLNGLITGRVSDTESVKDDETRNPEFIQRSTFDFNTAADDVERAEAFNDFLLSLPTEYIRSSSLIMSRESFKVLSKLKDPSGQKLLRVTQGVNPAINDFPVLFDDSLETVGTAGKYSVLVGDLEQAVDLRMYNVRFLANPYKTDGAVEFTYRARQYSNIKDANAVRAFYCP